jgi:glycosyltransferase involved in cell wall biosynthesis
MRLAIIGDTFPPLRTSGAVQLRDLAREFARQGHDVTVMVPAAGLARPFVRETMDGHAILRLRAPETKGLGLVRRGLAEFMVPLAMIKGARRSGVDLAGFDGVIWYSPMIFLGPVARYIARRSGCPAYLIIRDIFPQWAVDMGIMAKGAAYHVLSRVARYQYKVADVIGVQTAGNIAFMQSADAGRHGARIDVLHNWLGEAVAKPCSIDVAGGPLRGRRVFVYAGNIGVAQDIDLLVNLAGAMRGRSDAGFLLVGRGSEFARIQQRVADEGLDNVTMHGEIDPDEIPDLFRKCDVGMVSLDPRHTTHNIPGKFLTYMQAGLPVLACVNANNDLVDLVAANRVGRACVDRSLASLEAEAVRLLDETAADAEVATRCRELFASLYSAEAAVRQISQALMATKRAKARR